MIQNKYDSENKFPKDILFLQIELKLFHKNIITIKAHKCCNACNNVNSQIHTNIHQLTHLFVIALNIIKNFSDNKRVISGKDM